MRKASVLASAVISLLASAVAVHGGEVKEIYPGDPDLNLAILEPFEAEYEQMGVTMTVRLMKSQDPDPVFGVLMIMNMPGEIAVDQIGHRAADLGFAYRSFTFGRWGREVVHATNDGSKLSVSRMPLDGKAGEASSTSVDSTRGFFDGTFAHWLMALLPLEEGYSARLPTWSLRENGVEIDLAEPTTITAKEKVVAQDGTVHDCWLAETKGSGYTFKSYLSRKPPYLIKQVMVPEEGEPITAVMLRRVVGR